MENGDVAAHYEYAPFGAVAASVGERVSINPWRFSSEYAEDDTATVYYNYRHYEPVMGRWMSRDRIFEKSGKNIYQFTFNRPVASSDVLGNDVWIEDTKRAVGWHQRVCVDLWVRNDKGRCCHNGERYERIGKHCISFGDNSNSSPASGSSSNSSSGSSSGSSGSSNSSSSDTGSSNRNSSAPGASSGSSREGGQTAISTPISEFPAGFVVSHYNDSGTVFPDVEDDSTGIIDITKSDCSHDLDVYKYFMGLEGRDADYSVGSSNCRSFSRAVYEQTRQRK